MTDWSRLISHKRLGRPADEAGREPGRAPFEIDLDRITFSEAFRALQGKTQVHGLLGAPRARDRLTHSLEVSRVARTLGMRAGQRLAHDRRARELGTPPSPEDLGHLCAAAAAAHDFGTPPFAHVGEQAISDFFRHHPTGLSVAADVAAPVKAEIQAFEGNAQGFRDLARLQGWRRHGGLNLSCAVLAAHAKYPYRADAPDNTRLKACKYGHFAEDARLFEEVARETGLVQRGPGVWGRHPAAHLVEAADDICYSIVDLEDAARLGVLPQDEAEEMMISVAGDPGSDFADLEHPADRLACLRSKAISRLIDGTVDAFLNDLDPILAGDHAGDLAERGPHANAMRRIQAISRDRIYRCEARTKKDLRASAAIERILEAACRAFLERRDHGTSITVRNDRIVKLVPNGAATQPGDTARWLRVVLDWLASRTDDEAFEIAAMIDAGGRPARAA